MKAPPLRPKCGYVVTEVKIINAVYMAQNKQTKISKRNIVRLLKIPFWLVSFFASLGILASENVWALKDQKQSLT